MTPEDALERLALGFAAFHAVTKGIPQEILYKIQEENTPREDPATHQRSEPDRIVYETVLARQQNCHGIATLAIYFRLHIFKVWPYIKLDMTP